MNLVFIFNEFYTLHSPNIPNNLKWSLVLLIVVSMYTDYSIKETIIHSWCILRQFLSISTSKSGFPLMRNRVWVSSGLMEPLSTIGTAGHLLQLVSQESAGRDLYLYMLLIVLVHWQCCWFKCMVYYWLKVMLLIEIKLEMAPSSPLSPPNTSEVLPHI